MGKEKREIGALLLGIGATALLTILSIQVKTMPIYFAIPGYIVSSILILYGASYFFSPLERFWEGVMGIRFRAPFYLRDKDKQVEPQIIRHWLTEVLENDRRQLDSRIVAYATGKWDYSGIEDGKTECYIDVIINIENWAVFPITISGVKGSLQIDGELCTADVSMKNSHTFNRGDNGNIRVKQPINKATADKLREKRDSSTTTRNSIHVDFSQCHLIIKSDEPDFSMLPVEKVVSCTKDLEFNVL